MKNTTHMPSWRPEEEGRRRDQVAGGIVLLIFAVVWSLFWFVAWVFGWGLAGVDLGTWIMIYGALGIGLAGIVFAVALLLGRHGGRSIFSRALSSLAITGALIGVFGAGLYFWVGGGESPTFSDEFPAWSPRADLIAFSSDRGDDPGRIYVVRSDGSGLRRVSPLRSSSCPSWSPDGRKLVVERWSYSDSSSSSSLWVITVGGGKPHRLLRLSPSEPLLPAWSPQDGWIAFSKPLADGGSAIYLISADGKQLRRLTPRHAPGTIETHPSWSPDGRHLAFTFSRRGSDKAALAVISADGTGKRLLTGEREAMYEPSWSPDGTRLAFDCPEGICLMARTRPGSQRVVAPGGEAPAWAPDGNRIVFTRVTGQSPVWGVDATEPIYGLSVLDLRSGEIRQLS